MMWLIVDPRNSMEDRTFYTAGPENYVGTYQTGPFVGHVFSDTPLERL